MKILKTLEDAIMVANECMQNQTTSKRPALSGHGMKTGPSELNGNWSFDAIEPTLKYIFDTLHHTCYLLCVESSKPTLYKLEPSGIPDYHENLIRKTLKQRSKLAKTLRNKPLRVMNCIIKQRKSESTSSAEFPRWLDSIQYRLPDGVFILNLTDAVILRKDGRLPWEPMSTKTKLNPSLPILGGSGAIGYWDIPMPNYDDIRIIMGYDKIGNYETDWSAKKDVAVFRGGPTGCGTTPRTNQRLHLAEMRSPELDVGLTRVKTGNVRVDPEEGLSLIETDIKPVSFMNMEDQSKHKYIIHIDGNVAAYRLLHTMLTGSLILKVKGVFTLWTDHILEDGVHYIGIKADLSDLQEKLNWCKHHDKECRAIAKKGLEFAQKALTPDYINASFVKLLWSLKKQTSS